MSTATAATTDTITCEIDGARVHSIELHLRKNHPTWTVAQYQEKYPSAPLLSETAKRVIAQKRAAAAAAAPAPAAAATPAAPAPTEEASVVMRALNEAFGMPDTKATRGASGNPIQIPVCVKPAMPEMVPDIDPNYVHDGEFIKNLLMALSLNIPSYVWGHAGTGKTTGIEQVCARIGRELLRVQHTINTEESHIVGQWVARSGETHFELGPLPMAMLNGWVYLADEYDFALPSVLSVYQSVLEGKPLVIKEADAANRIIRPHPNFRFIATGNTNGSGDETGLYQGTNIQNAANFDRFHMVLQVKYMEAAREIEVVKKQAAIDESDAKALVGFANQIRESFEAKKLSTPISPRTLIAAAMIGARKGAYRAGIELAYANKLSAVDREVVSGVAQRIFG